LINETRTDRSHQGKNNTILSSQAQSNPLKRQKGDRDLNTELIKRDDQEYLNIDSSASNENSHNSLEISGEIIP
jgi:hypothetical protein